MNDLEELKRIVNEHLVAPRRVHMLADKLFEMIAIKLAEPKPEAKKEAPNVTSR